jgi:hypothetical protein
MTDYFLYYTHMNVLLMISNGTTRQTYSSRPDYDKKQEHPQRAPAHPSNSFVSPTSSAAVSERREKQQQAVVNHGDQDEWKKNLKLPPKDTRVKTEVKHPTYSWVSFIPSIVH